MSERDPNTAGDDPGTFRKVSSAMYHDERYLALTAVQPSGRSLWIHLITGPHLNPIPGLSRCGRAALAEELGWSQEAFDEAFREVFEQGMAQAYWNARVIWLPNAIKHNFPQSPNVVRSWRKFWPQIPDCPLKREAYETFRSLFAERGEPFLRAFEEACKPSWKPSPKTSTKVCPNQRAESRENIRERERRARPSRRATSIQSRQSSQQPSTAMSCHPSQRGERRAVVHRLRTTSTRSGRRTRSGSTRRQLGKLTTVLFEAVPIQPKS